MYIILKAIYLLENNEIIVERITNWNELWICSVKDCFSTSMSWQKSCELFGQRMKQQNIISNYTSGKLSAAFIYESSQWSKLLDEGLEDSQMEHSISDQNDRIEEIRQVLSVKGFYPLPKRFWKHLALHNAFLLPGVSERGWISIGQEQIFMLLGFSGDILITCTGIVKTFKFP